jgi:hypothetical protein
VSTTSDPPIVTVSILRGGFGLYYDNVFQNIPLFMIQQANPTIYQGVFSISNATEIVPGTGIPLASWRYGVDPFPVIPPPSSQLADGATGRLMESHYRNPFTEEFNFGYQWAMTPNSVVEVEYVHTLGLHENKTVNLNPVDPATGNRPLSAAFAAAGVPVLGRISAEESVNRSRYDGLNFSYRKRMSRRFSVNANYTVSRAMGHPTGYPEVGSGFRNYPHDPAISGIRGTSGRHPTTNVTSPLAALVTCPGASRCLRFCSGALPDHFT